MPSVLSFHEQHVRAFGEVWTVQAVPASVWLQALHGDSEHLSGVFPGLVHDDGVDSMLRVWLEVPDAGQRCELAARRLLGRAAGMDWVWAWNLMRLVLRGWLFINGLLLRQSVRASEMSLSDWLAAAYTLIYENRDEAGRVALELELSTPPRGARLVIPAAIQHQGGMAFALD